MQTRSLNTLATISKVGSFATAAEQLGTTLSTVSMQMKTLESELNAQLFDRAFRPPKLTPLGRRIAGLAGELVRLESALVKSCQPSETLTGKFRLGFIPTASVRVMPQFLKRAGVTAPEAEFELETGLSEALETKVGTGLLDAAVITASQSPPAGVAYHVLAEETLRFAIPVRYEAMPVGELARQLPFLQFTPSSGIGKVIARNAAGLIGERYKHLVIDSVEAIMECVNEGLGFTLLSEHDIARYAKAETVMLDPPGAPVKRQLVLAMRKGQASGMETGRLLELFSGQ